MHENNIKDKKTIQEGLERNVQGEIINDFACDACQKRVDCTSKTVLKTLPNMMLIHLKRFTFDFDQLKEVKLNDRCEFSKHLNMRPYMYDEVLEKDAQQRKEEHKRNQEMEDQQAKVKD